MAKNIDIGGRLHSVATEHIVAGANEIQDDTLNKTQAQVNEEINSTLEIYSSAIEGLNSQNYKSYTATNGTTAITDVLPALGAVDTIYRLGNWDGEQYDTTQYAEYTWRNTGIDQGEYVLLDVKNYGIDEEPAADSENLVKSRGIKTATTFNTGQIVKDIGIVNDATEDSNDKIPTTLAINTLTKKIYNNDIDFAIADESGKTVAEFFNGHIKTKKFDSSQVQNILIDVENETLNININ